MLYDSHSITLHPPTYTPTGYDLLRYASHMHVLAPPPDALLVDDLHALADLPAPPGDGRPRPRDMALCRILAALHEATVRLSWRRF